MKAKVTMLTIALLATLAWNAVSQTTATGHVSVTIVSPISIAKVQDMNFGHVSVESGSGAVILSPESSERSASGDVELMDGGDVSLAAFAVKGHQGATFSITLPTTPVIINNGNKNMVVTNFTSTPNGFAELSDGSRSIYVGATLVVNGDQQLGEYTSSTPFPVTVNYN